ncbi:MAG: DUF3667 domain-containing protein [Bacteroidetes bacterium]|nr:DUF3667 domain-containing protein [Bacteroidota bacterium]
MNCTYCNAIVSSSYCPDCGRPAQLPRIDGRYILREIEHVLEFERGIFFTIRELVTNPGRNIQRYLAEDRSRLVKPVVFIIITSLIYTFCNHLFHFEDGYIKYGDAKRTATTDIFAWVQANYGYANIIMGIFIALWTLLLFRRYRYNFFEILILLCFVIGMNMLIYALSGVIQGITHIGMMRGAGIIGIIYTTWAVGQFFDRSKPANYVKALLAYLAGMLTFTLAAMLLGAVIELLP